MLRKCLLPAAFACLTVGGCHGPGSKAPTGQVVAIVGGQEVTIRELNAELNGSLPSDPKQLRAVKQAALRSVIIRKLLAQQAEREKLQKTPEFALQKQRLTEVILARDLQSRLAASVPQPSDEEVQSFMSAHPDLFAQRRVYSIDQIQAQGPIAQTVLKAALPLKTLEDVNALLGKNGIQSERRTVQLDAARVQPRLAETIAKLAPNDILIIPEPESVSFNVVRNSIVKPFTGADAVNIARQLSHQQSIQEAESRQVRQIMAAKGSRVVYNAAYRPSVNAASNPTGTPSAAQPAGVG